MNQKLGFIEFSHVQQNIYIGIHTMRNTQPGYDTNVGKT